MKGFVVIFGRTDVETTGVSIYPDATSVVALTRKLKREGYSIADIISLSEMEEATTQGAMEFMQWFRTIDATKEHATPTLLAFYQLLHILFLHGRNYERTQATPQARGAP